MGCVASLTFEEDMTVGVGVNARDPQPLEGSQSTGLATLLHTASSAFSCHTIQMACILLGLHPSSTTRTLKRIGETGELIIILLALACFMAASFSSKH